LQKHCPLAVDRNIGGLPQDVGDRKAICLGDRHTNPWHQPKVVGHVALVASAEIGCNILGPLIGFGEEHLAWRIGIERRPDVLYDGMGLGKILVAGSFSLAEVWNRAQPEAIDAQVEPVPHDPHDRHKHTRIVEV
jgi:hypothetical protein